MIAAVNPFVPTSLQRSAGYTTAPDGEQIPSYTTTPQMVQVQALDARELAFLDGLGVQGVLRKAYLNGDWRGIYRPTGQGGDLFMFDSTAAIPASLQGTTWKVVHVFETWPDWCSLAIQLQMGSA